MTTFGRNLRERDLEALGVAAAQLEPSHWWRDLLSLWCPSGTPTGEFGLRLAIRDGYMNFYRRGQSVARVRVVKGTGPIFSVHAKYVLSEQDRKFLQGSEYVTLTGTNALLRRNAKTDLHYDGIETLKAWIKTVDEGYSGEEKCLVDQLLDVPANDGVIDLEMGLPAWSGKVTAPRMDLVSIDRRDSKLTVFFGEVKRVTDGRIRCRAEVRPDEMPEVLSQMADYRKFLAADGHSELVGKQYANCARVLVRLRAMADSVGPVRKLGQTILDAAKCDQLDVAGLATLIVINDAKANQIAWATHRAKLETQKDQVPMIVLDGPGALKLTGATAQSYNQHWIT